MFDGWMRLDGWIVPTATERDADGRGKASSSSRTRVSFIGVDAEKRAVEHPNPNKRIIIVNESNRIESRSSAAVWIIARER